MLVAQASRTAMMTAVGRGQHRQLHERPWVFDDPYALPLVGPAWHAVYERLRGLFPEPVLWGAGSFVNARARYAEDRLAAGACAQYVVLGAGLDSFAWRRPDLLGSLRVFEVDHPATQAWKQERVQALGLPVDDRHVLAPVDLRHERLTEGLALAGFDPAVPTLFSWLGTAFYLSVEAIETTLRAVADCAPGSEIVFDYVLTEAHWDVAGRQFMDTFRAIAADAGEPVDTLLSPTEAEALVQRCGLSVAEHLGSEDVHDRYFAARRDGLKPYTCERLMAAITRDARCSGPGTAPPARDRSGGSR